MQPPSYIKSLNIINESNVDVHILVKYGTPDQENTNETIPITLEKLVKSQTETNFEEQIYHKGSYETFAPVQFVGIHTPEKNNGRKRMYHLSATNGIEEVRRLRVQVDENDQVILI